MPLKDYTTTVPVGRSVSQVQSLLVEAGARAVMTEYDDTGHIAGMSFAVQTGYGQQSYKLPVRSEQVHILLKRDKVAPRYQTPEHAERVAWRILRDWLDAQLAIIKAGMVTVDQVMLPYARTEDDSTVYEQFIMQRLALTGGTPE